MTNIVLIWELGADLGHVSRMDALARRLLDRGHSPSFVLSRPAELERLYPAGNRPPYPFFAAPFWPDKPTRLSREPANLVEILLALGYHRPTALLQRLREWRAILAGLDPDVIILDYAPTAQLAARGYPCRQICLDDPFSRPPDIAPIPAFENRVSQQNLLISEAKLLDSVNQALNELQIDAIHHAYQIFSAEKAFLFSIAELDPFAPLRQNCEYVGPADDSIINKIPLRWSGSRPKKIFAYLKPGYPAIREFLAVLNEATAEINVFLPGAGEELLQFCSANAIAVSALPYDMSNLHTCDLVICHGGHATTLHAVLSGVPVLIIPLQQEQLSTARACINRGFGMGLGPRVTYKESIAQAIRLLLDDPNFQINAQNCAAIYRDQLTRSALKKVADYVDTQQ